MEGREARRSMTLSEHMSVMDNSCHLRELLKVRDEDDGRLHSTRGPLALGSASASEKREGFAAGASSSRTLMDIIREEQEMSGRGLCPNGTCSTSVNWRAFKDRLRLRCRDADPSGHPDGDDLVTSLPTSPVFRRSLTVRRAETPVRRVSSVRDPAAAAVLPYVSGGGGGGGEGAPSSRDGGPSVAGEEEQQQPVRVSLMALLEQTDGQGGFLAAEEEAEAEEEEEVEGGGMYHVCCVCMVRHKGAAFIPCGHTFCRLCSRELWVSRGNCPLCNGYILEILDIF